MKPADPGGMTVLGKDATILSGRPDGETVLAPPPEAPKLQALREQAAAEEAARAAAAAKLAAAQRPPEPKPAPTPAPVAAAPAAPVAAAAPAETVALRTPLPPVPRVPPPAPPRPAAAQSAPAPAQPAVHRGTLVQLAALQSEAAAMAEWHRLERRMPALLNGKSPTVMKVEHDGRVFYRLRTGGFSGSAQAGQFCSEVKAKGGGCTIAAF